MTLIQFLLTLNIFHPKKVIDLINKYGAKNQWRIIYEVIACFHLLHIVELHKFCQFIHWMLPYMIFE